MPPARAAAALLVLVAAPGALPAEGPPWSYGGPTGPEAWGLLDPAYEACATGREQSPVDLVGAVPAALGELVPAWAPGAEWVVVNDGQTIRADLAEGITGGHLEIEGKVYDLVQFRFHHPSEHAVDSRRSEMEVQFVHRAGDGSLAVLGVLLTGGGAPGLVERLFQAAPVAEGEASVGAADPRALLPASGGYFRYQGSLTTPPCSETVTWTVMAEPLAITDAAVQAFAAIFPDAARPLQPLHRRYVLSN